MSSVYEHRQPPTLKRDRDNHSRTVSGTPDTKHEAAEAADPEQTNLPKSTRNRFGKGIHSRPLTMHFDESRKTILELVMGAAGGEEIPRIRSSQAAIVCNAENNH